MATDYTWPKPWLIQLYSRVIAEGCLRINLRGKTTEENDAEFRSFKGAFLRCRRKRDAGYVAQMRPEFQLVGIRYEQDRGSVLLVYDALPDDELLPSIESVDKKQQLPQPIGSRPHETPVEEPDNFDPTKFVSGMIDGLEIEEDEDNGTTEL